ncbi:phosphatase PAP2 family protein, partial [Aliihoeflea sp. 40Bstr573]|uniref:phosphatase PAP2 family protein n=1 Tax=Aliihoeflea sp. 40Bstr573 TaxID=2696467 RepID=UPI002094C850
NPYPSSLWTSPTSQISRQPMNQAGFIRGTPKPVPESIRPHSLASVGGGLLISSVAKEFFDRPRPDLVPHGSFVHTASFPSGHSMMAAVVYLTLGVLVARTLPQRRLKIFVLSLAAMTTILVGISRVYLGVHWPTDVLAGWLAGAGWATVCMLVARVLARRGEVEPEVSQT